MTTTPDAIAALRWAHESVRAAIGSGWGDCSEHEYRVKVAMGNLYAAAGPALAEAEALRATLTAVREAHQQACDEFGVMRVEFYSLYEAFSERGENKSPPVERARSYLKHDDSAVRDERDALRARVAELEAAAARRRPTMCLGSADSYIDDDGLED